MKNRKRKFVQVTVTVALIMGAFLVGKFTEIPWYEGYVKSHVIITDWNTDGDTLSLMLSNGTELYADKRENVYTGKLKKFVAFSEVDHLYDNCIITKDGNIYDFD